MTPADRSAESESRTQRHAMPCHFSLPNTGEKSERLGCQSNSYGPLLAAVPEVLILTLITCASVFVSQLSMRYLSCTCLCQITM